MNGLRILVAGGIAATLACTSMAAHADEEKGLAVGVRVGGAIPYGDAQSGTSMSHFQRASIPVWFDLGYRFNRNLYLGLFYQFAATFPASHNCSVGPNPAQDPGLQVANQQTTCDGRDQRFGIDFAYHIRPTAFVDPWIGLGLGYEVSTLDYATGASAELSSFQASGPSVDLQLGVDLRFSKVIPVGPFVDFSLADFGTESYYDANGTGQGPVPFGSAIHGWAVFGLRSQFNL